MDTRGICANGMPVAQRLNSNEITICLFKQVTVDKLRATSVCAVCVCIHFPFHFVFFIYCARQHSAL